MKKIIIYFIIFLNFSCNKSLKFVVIYGNLTCNLCIYDLNNKIKRKYIYYYIYDKSQNDLVKIGLINNLNKIVKNPKIIKNLNTPDTLKNFPYIMVIKKNDTIIYNYDQFQLLNTDFITGKSFNK